MLLLGGQGTLQNEDTKRFTRKLRDDMSGQIMNLKGCTLAHGGNAMYSLDKNDRTFSKRMYTNNDKHTGEQLPYMRSTIDLSFDGGNYFGIKKEIKENDLKNILATSETKGKFAAPKDLFKI